MFCSLASLVIINLFFTSPAPALERISKPFACLQNPASANGVQEAAPAIQLPHPHINWLLACLPEMKDRAVPKVKRVHP